MRGHGAVVTSWRDLGREGHGGAYAGASPWARQGIFVQGLDMRPTRESGPGLPLDRRDRLENPGLKRAHAYLDAGGVCLTCNMVKEGHDRLMRRIG